MCIALATYRNRIASLLESSEKFVIIQSPSYDIKNSKSITISNNSPNELLKLLKNNNVKILICGAISGYLRHILEVQNIEVIPWITGNIQSVIQAFRSDNLVSSSFIMPGCRRGECCRYRFQRGRQNFIIINKRNRYMKIAISALGPDLQAQVDARFGRAQYFIIIDTATMEFEAVSNESTDAMHGAGIQSGQLMSSKGVSAVITGQVGPNAHQTLTAAGIQIFHSDSITVEQAVEAYNKGQLQQITQSAPAHGGMSMKAGK